MVARSVGGAGWAVQQHNRCQDQTIGLGAMLVVLGVTPWQARAGHLSHSRIGRDYRLLVEGPALVAGLS
jgi:hypothetical protein